MNPVIPPLPPGLFERAYHASGEKRLWLARAAFPLLIGPAWRYALLAFAYLKLFDNEVDEDSDTPRAADVFGVHRMLVERIYAGADPDPALPFVQRIGAFVFAFDRANGSPIRRWLADAVESMAIDIGRRGKVVSRREIEANLHLGGGGTLRGFAWFAAPHLDLPDALVHALCDAYMHSDTLMDLEHDLAFGLVNVPAEDVARGVDPAQPDARLAGWVHEQVAVCETLFETARRRLREVPSVRLRVLLLIFLANKQRKLRRFLAADAWPAPTQEAEASGRT